MCFHSVNLLYVSFDCLSFFLFTHHLKKKKKKFTLCLISFFLYEYCFWGRKDVDLIGFLLLFCDLTSVRCSHIGIGSGNLIGKFYYFYFFYRNFITLLTKLKVKIFRGFFCLLCLLLHQLTTIVQSTCRSFEFHVCFPFHHQVLTTLYYLSS